MSEILPTDTPIVRTSIARMTPEVLTDYVQTLQTRRLEAYKIYQLGQEAKKKSKDSKDIAMIAKTLASFEKKYESVKKALDALEKMATDIQAARIAMGEFY